MISWNSLLTGSREEHDNLRYSECNDGVPKIVVWNTTSACNLRCQHCYFAARPTSAANELSQKEAEDFIEDLADLGVAVLLFSGGEPLLRKDIFGLGKFAQDRGIRTVLSTNGTLITEEAAEQIKQAEFSYAGISLDGLERINDKFRNKPGAFTQALKGIANCQKVGLKVGLRLTLTKHNLADLAAIFDLVEREEIRRLCIYHLVYTGRGASLKENDLTHQERRKALELIWVRTTDFSQRQLKIEVLTVDNHADGVWIYLKLKKIDPQRAQQVFELLETQGGNSSGIKIGAVDNCGRIFADQFFRTHVLGNIRQTKFSLVWQDRENIFLQQLRNRAPLLKGRCQRCNFLSICNGNFRARAEAVFNDPWAEDPACYLTDQEIKCPLYG
ncbi:MAG: radical SAM protein [Omnitrophica bacterium]|nr:radical SAM protein [Candidatus Omnitrophota bacterium]